MYEVKVNPMQISFVHFVVVFFVDDSICSLLIPLLLSRFNVVVVNGHDDTESPYDACDTAIRMEREEAFLANVDSKGRDVKFVPS